MAGLFETLLQNIPTEQYGLLQGFFFPFILIVVIFFAGIEFALPTKTRINMVIAIVLALLASQSPLYPWIASSFVTLGAYSAILAFGALFIFGVGAWVYNRGRDIYHESGDKMRRAEKLTKEILKINEKIDEAAAGGEEKKVSELLEVKKRLEEQRNAILRTGQT